MSRIGTIELKGASGRRYTFNVYSFENTFTTEQKGVYAVTHRTVSVKADTDHAILFIGESHNLRSTFRDHPLIEDFQKENANCVLAHWEDSEENRRLIQEDLVSRFHPPCNLRHENIIH